MSTPAGPDPDVEPRWLDPDELQSWFAFSGMLLTLPGVLDAQLQRDADLTLFGYLVMAGLSDSPDRTRRMSELAVLTQGSLSRLSHAVAKLERNGWVVRNPCPGNGRVTNATLTDSGQAKLEAAAPGHVETVRRLVIDPIGSGLFASLGEVSRRIVDATEGGGCPTFRPSESDPSRSGANDAGARNGREG